MLLQKTIFITSMILGSALYSATQREKEERLIYQVSALLNYNKTLQESLNNRSLQQTIQKTLLELDQFNEILQEKLTNAPIELMLIESTYPYANLGSVLQSYRESRKLKPKILALILLKAMEYLLVVKVIFAKAPASLSLSQEIDNFTTLSTELLKELNIPKKSLDKYLNLSLASINKIPQFAFELLNSISSAPATLLLDDMQLKTKQLKSLAKEQDDADLNRLATEIEKLLTEYGNKPAITIPTPPPVITMPAEEPILTKSDESTLAGALTQALKKLKDASTTERPQLEKTKTWQERLYETIQKRRKSIQEAEEEQEEESTDWND